MAERNSITFIWHIENLNGPLKRKFHSPVFDAAGTDWRMTLDQGSYKGEDVKCSLCKCKRGIPSITVDLEARVQIPEKDPTIESVQNKTFTHETSHMVKVLTGKEAHRDVVTIKYRLWSDAIPESIRYIARTRLTEDRLVAVAWPIPEIKPPPPPHKTMHYDFHWPPAEQASKAPYQKALLQSFPGLPSLSIKLNKWAKTRRIKDAKIHIIGGKYEAVLSMKFRALVVDGEGRKVQYGEHEYINYEDNSKVFLLSFLPIRTTEQRTDTVAVPNGNLTLQLVVSWHRLSSHCVESIRYGSIPPPQNVEPKPTTEVLENTTVCSDSTTQLHASLRFGVFRAMLDEGLVRIPEEVNADIVARMMSHAYSRGTPSDMSADCAARLHSAAVLNVLRELRVACSDLLKSGLDDTSNACKVLVLAESHGVLAAAARDYTVRRMKAIRSKDEWHRLSKHETELGAEIMSMEIAMKSVA